MVEKISKTITVSARRRICLRLEKEFWRALDDISEIEGCSLSILVELIEETKEKDMSLASAIRVFSILYFEAASTEEGHQRAGHGNIRNMMRRAGKRYHPED